MHRIIVSFFLASLLSYPSFAGNTSKTDIDIASDVQKGRIHSAIAHCAEGLRENPNDVRLNHWMLALYQHEGNLEASIRQAKRNLELNPNFPGAYRDMWYLQFVKGDIDEAERYIRLAISSLEQSNQERRLKRINEFDFQLWLALTLCRQGRIHETQTALEQAIQN